MDKISFELNSNRVLLEPIEPKKSSFDIPDSLKEKSLQGVVVAVGPGKFEYGHLVPMHCKVGDLVTYEERFGSSKMTIEGKSYILLNDPEVIGTFITTKS